ncbi:MAG: 3-dehydroquinate synthase [Rickettsiales bacterium]|nr:3-dehydroquinate synthase [Rickettsiales bacterium]|tara:strand:- start:6465 stop:7592 length:1128 start_codon:yes stop_codon:yes gene_type:complete
MILHNLSLSSGNRHKTAITVGSNCIEESLTSLTTQSKRVFVLSQESLLKDSGYDIMSVVKSAYHSDCHLILVADGESAKSMTTYTQCLNHIFDIGVERGDTIIGFGGGVVTDLAGFIASTCLRGIKLINIPTTLLAQVDAAIGGKTGINHPSGKNLIGSFYQPHLIINDIAILASLPKEESQSGFAEIIKYGIIQDRDLFDLLLAEANTISKFDYIADHDLWLNIITKSIKNKIYVVEEDEKESSLRAILNFGHTIGHGIEALFGYNMYKHGFCVAFGMCAATYIAVKKSLISQDMATAIYRILNVYDYHRISLDSIHKDRLLAIIARDKKVKDSKIRFVLPTHIGKVIVSPDVSESDIIASIEFIESFFTGVTP